MLTVVNIALAALIAAALVGFGLFDFVIDPPRHRPTTQHVDSAARLRDRNIDPAKLTQTEVFHSEASPWSRTATR